MVVTGELLADTIRAALIPMVKAMVDNPDDVRVDCDATPNKTIFVHFTVHRDDRGIVIGRDGKAAHAIRTLLASIAGKYQHRAVMEIVE